MPESRRSKKPHAHAAPEILLEAERAGHLLRLRLENSQMECRADFERIEPVKDDPSATEPAAPPPFPPAELIQILQQHGMTQTIDYPALYLFCAATAEGAEQSHVLLAQGSAPESGTDGWFEMSVKTEGKPDYQEDAKGNVDLRTLNLHTEAVSGQKLGTVHLPKAGRAGVTVHGLPIPAEQGKPFKLIAGDGVLLKYDGRIAFAAKAGRALLNTQTLSVVDELVISGDLDLKVGNINFHGFVEIRGDVLDDFSIKASKGIKVNGNVGACRLESGGLVEIGSMSGRERGEILCHGDLKANYLNQVQVSCYGNVLVRQEIRNSQIKASGYIIVERGAIIGGKCLSLEGIEASVLGAVSGVRTHVVAGRYFPDTDRFDLLHQRLYEIEQQLGLIYAALGPLKENKQLNGALKNASEFRLAILNQQWEKLEQKKTLLNAELAASNPQLLSNANPKINVLKLIHEGVVACLGKSSEKISLQLSGPMTLIENSRDGGLRHLKHSPLHHPAAVIEAEILQNEPDEDGW